MTDTTVAQTIKKQIQTMNPGAFMVWGAKNFVAGDDMLMFQVKGSKLRRGGKIVVTYNYGADDYTVEALQIIGTNVKSKGKVEHIYFDMLGVTIDDMVG